ncbi:serine protease inhibitor ecotin [Pseudomonas akapageensis]|uniref:serine protease inhibitor ecotin n=1 Tax=Pseudomonas akapageensis TaxID=2609961 RepID=UPI001407C9D3|nr:serine protease inhibitor ecotin [Pseudomonas akapageensis]
MRISILTTLALSLTALGSQAFAANLKDVAPYPEAEAGFTRQVIHLPAQTDENNYQVEIVAGKQLDVDCNRQRLGGTLDEKTLQGWGYSYYRLEAVKGPMSTLMACPDSKKTMAFVPVVGEGFMLRYNSKLPIVVYAPKGVEVNYRVWSAGEQLSKAKEE